MVLLPFWFEIFLRSYDGGNSGVSNAVIAHSLTATATGVNTVLISIVHTIAIILS